MTTSKRTPIKRDRHVLTPEAVEAFVAALKLRTHREQQIGDSTSCAGIDGCETCKAYERHVAVVSRHLHVAPWGFHPVDVADCPPPPWFDAAAAKAWENARRTYCDLCDAAGVKRAKRVEVSDVTRSHITLRWIERLLRIPEGGKVGQPVRLRPWQRDIVRSIYGTGFGDAGDDIRRALAVR